MSKDKMGKIPEKYEEPEEPKKVVSPDGKVEISIEPRDIALGIPGHAYLCAFSRGAVRSIPGAYNVATTREGIRVFFGTKHGGYRFFPFNEVISEAIREYDVTGKMKPMTWEIQL